MAKERKSQFNIEELTAPNHGMKRDGILQSCRPDGRTYDRFWYLLCRSIRTGLCKFIYWYGSSCMAAGRFNVNFADSILDLHDFIF